MSEKGKPGDFFRSDRRLYEPPKAFQDHGTRPRQKRRVWTPNRIALVGALIVVVFVTASCLLCLPKA